MAALIDPIADLLTTLRNGQMARLAAVSCPSSAARKRVLDVLEREGYIRGYSEEEIRKNVKKLKIELRYHEGQPVIKTLKKVSKSGRRVYTDIANLPKVHNGLGISIISTSKGVLADHEARAQNVGGEILCEVF